MINRFFHHKENIPFFIGDDIILQHCESKRIGVAKTFAQAKGNKAFTFCQLLKLIKSEDLRTKFYKLHKWVNRRKKSVKKDL
jgi:hypothetical protein